MIYLVIIIIFFFLKKYLLQLFNDHERFFMGSCTLISLLLSIMDIQKMSVFILLLEFMIQHGKGV